MQMMDIVDGSVYGQALRLGKSLDGDNLVQCEPEMELLNMPLYVATNATACVR